MEACSSRSLPVQLPVQRWLCSIAPATGEETREYLGQRAREGKDRAAEAARQGREILNKQRENLTTAFDRARDQFHTRETGQDA